MLCRTKASTITKAQQLLAVPLEHQEAQANVSRRVTVYKTVSASEPHWSTAPLAPCRADTACKMSDNLPWACRATFESDSSLSRHLPLSPTPPLLSSTWAPLSYQRLAAKLASAAWLPGYRGGKKCAKHNVRRSAHDVTARLQTRTRETFEGNDLFPSSQNAEVWQLSLPRPATSPVPTTQTSGAVTALLFSAPHLMTVTLTTIASHFPRKWCFQVLLPRNRACMKHAILNLNSFNNWVFFPLKRQTLNLLKIFFFSNYIFLVFVWHQTSFIFGKLHHDM